MGLVDSVATGFRRPEVPGLAHLAACPVPTTGDGQARAQQPAHTHLPAPESTVALGGPGHAGG